MSPNEFFKKYPNKNINDYYTFLKTENITQSSIPKSENKHSETTYNYNADLRNDSNQRGNTIIGKTLFFIIGLLIGYLFLPEIIDKTIQTNDSSERTIDNTEDASTESTDEKALEAGKVYCPNCNGAKYVEKICRGCDGTGLSNHGDECLSCGGGGRYDRLCDVCEGSGYVDENLVH
jgi:hypothetical protein